MGKSAQICHENVKETMDLLEYLGFLINREKSEPDPSTRRKFLGLILDSVRYCIEFPSLKRRDLISLIKAFLGRKSCSIEEFSKLIGKLISACPAVEYGLLYTRILEREKIAALRMSDFDYGCKMLIPRTVFPNLKWWLRPSQLQTFFKRLRNVFTKI